MKSSDLILVIDMQKVYLPGKPWACGHVERAVSNVSKLLDRVIDVRDGAELTGKVEDGECRAASVSGHAASGEVQNDTVNVNSSCMKDGGIEKSPEEDNVITYRAPSVILTRFIAPFDEDAVGTWKKYNELNREINENPVMEEFIPSIARYVEEFPYYDKCTYSCFSNPYVRAAADKAMVHGGDIVLTGVVSECCVLSTFFQGVDLGYHFVYLKDASAGVDSETEQAVEKVLEGLGYVHVDVMTTQEYMDRK